MTKYLVVLKPGFIGLEKLGANFVGTLSTKFLTFEILAPSFLGFEKLGAKLGGIQGTKFWTFEILSAKLCGA